MLTAWQLPVQAVYVDGEYWDICVKYGNTGKIFLLVKNFENVKAPGILKQEAEATARCEGVLEDEDEGLFWPSLDPLVKKGCYIFYPKREKDGEPHLHVPNVLGSSV